VDDGGAHEEIAVVEAYSLSGATLLMGMAVADDTLITLYGGDEEFQATARKCVDSSNGYLVGVSFWDQPPSYVPEHLLDVSRLVH